MGDSIDDLLAQIKEEYKPSVKENKNITKKTNYNSSKSIQKSSPTMNNSHNFNSSSDIDDLLSEVKAEFAQGNSAEKKTVSQEKDLTKNLIEKDLQNLQNYKKNTPQPRNYSSNQNNNYHSSDPLINSLKKELINEQIEALETQKREEKIKLQKQQQQEKLKAQRKREALTNHAKEWLKNLDINSDEGIWFEEFSYGYESKLDAAIDYLEALREVRLSS